MLRWAKAVQQTKSQNQCCLRYVLQTKKVGISATSEGSIQICLWTKPQDRMLLCLTERFPGRLAGVVKKQMCCGVGV